MNLYQSHLDKKYFASVFKILLSLHKKKKKKKKKMKKKKKRKVTYLSYDFYIVSGISYDWSLLLDNFQEFVILAMLTFVSREPKCELVYSKYIV